MTLLHPNGTPLDDGVVRCRREGCHHIVSDPDELCGECLQVHADEIREREEDQLR